MGPRQAERFSLHFLKASPSEAAEFSAALKELKSSVRLCARCFAYCEAELCPICLDPGRDARQICVVEEPQDIEAIEKTGSFKGYYHVLGGALSPADGVHPDSLRAAELLARVKRSAGEVEEIIIATDPDTGITSTQSGGSALLTVEP